MLIQIKDDYSFWTKLMRNIGKLFFWEPKEVIAGMTLCPNITLITQSRGVRKFCEHMINKFLIWSRGTLLERFPQALEHVRQVRLNILVPFCVYAPQYGASYSLIFQLCLQAALYFLPCMRGRSIDVIRLVSLLLSQFLQDSRVIWILKKARFAEMKTFVCWDELMN